MTKQLQLLALFVSVLAIACGNSFSKIEDENEIIFTKAQLNETVLITHILPPRPPCPVGFTTAARRDRAQGNCASHISSVIELRG